MTAPLLVFGWGNASRGDDALGPLFVQRLSALAATAKGNSKMEFLQDYQLQIEHALDLVSRERVLFVDASLSCGSPFEATTLRAERDVRFSTHAMSPEAVMQVYRDLYRAEPPACTLLAIRGVHFELGEPPGPEAREHLAHALIWGRGWMESNLETVQQRTDVCPG
jgi:hydrogenase maturation protease